MLLKDEFDFIKRIKPKNIHQTSLKKGIGDDSAVFEGSSTFDELICMDTMVEGVHFTKQTMTPFMIGYKALAVNISDIAAMGGMPTYYLVSIAIPSDWTEKELNEIYAGMSLLGNDYSVDLIGGDTVSSKQGLIVTVTVCGRIEKGRSLYRDQAQPGDYVFVVGEVGASAAGLELLLKHGYNYPYTDSEKKLLQAHQLPEPQVEAGRILANANERISLNDISDGLASEANEIAEASNVELTIDYEKIPRSDYIKNYSDDQKKKWSLFGGEDYQLVGTMPKEAFTKINQTFNQKGVKLTIIGEVTTGHANVYITMNGKKERLHKQGFNHFK
ncbi:thiamine-phosphate kinase [Anaerobacillus arseniciselenatis]|uniref:Thiamine-monophosphate kinase n=1 Tax=Anaerobacillus arseniciselenatis TaxID=85682 RepID=A0A1S2LUM6_9BACI|nr:thiamine-phosphate kinase [Anaerobacillus arseniciselenatis]OIJ16228.1 thiamine-phosphate kinase [Anaerobacillus arseniciselenatis]